MQIAARKDDQEDNGMAYPYGWVSPVSGPGSDGRVARGRGSPPKSVYGQSQKGEREREGDMTTGHEEWESVRRSVAMAAVGGGSGIIITK